MDAMGKNKRKTILDYLEREWKSKKNHSRYEGKMSCRGLHTYKNL